MIMCRLVALAMRNPVKELVSSVIEAFVKSSQYDPYLERASKGKYSQHIDGWGLAYIGSIDNTYVIGYHKQLDPVFSEQSRRILDYFINKLVGLDAVHAIIHARKASITEPIGLEYAHPYMYRLGKNIIWFAHNGGARKTELAAILNENPILRTDSDMLGLYIALRLSKCVETSRDIDMCLIESYLGAKEYISTNNAMNTALMLATSVDIGLYLSHWINSSQPELREYYSMISITSSEATIAGSITLLEYLPVNLRESASLMREGLYKLKPGSLERIAIL